MTRKRFSNLKYVISPLLSTLHYLLFSLTLSHPLPSAKLDAAAQFPLVNCNCVTATSQQQLQVELELIELN